ERLDLEKREHLGLQRRVERTKLLRITLERFVSIFLEAIDRAEERADPGFVETERLEVEKPQVAITEPHPEIRLGEPECTEALHEQRDQFDLRLGTRLAKDIRVK